MNEEIFNQRNDSLVSFPMIVTQNDILLGIKLDRVILWDYIIILK